MGGRYVRGQLASDTWPLSTRRSVAAGPVVIGVGRVLVEERAANGPGQRTWIDGLAMAMHRTERGRARGRAARAKEARRGAAGRHAEGRVGGRQVLRREARIQADAAQGGAARAWTRMG